MNQETMKLQELMELWAANELMKSELAQGTIDTYQGVIRRVNRFPISKKRIDLINQEELQSFFDLLYRGGLFTDELEQRPLSFSYRRIFYIVFQRAFRYAVFPLDILQANPMDHVVLKREFTAMDLFPNSFETDHDTQTIDHMTFLRIEDYLKTKNNPALLSIQISYYTGLRIGEVCGLVWSDIDLETRQITVCRSLHYSSINKKHIIGPTKRNKRRTVYFCDTLAVILHKARDRQLLQKKQLGSGYYHNYYIANASQGPSFYELITKNASSATSSEYHEIELVCVRNDGRVVHPDTIGIVCRSIRKKISGLEYFHFHQLRHPYVKQKTKKYEIFFEIATTGDLCPPFLSPGVA